MKMITENEKITEKLKILTKTITVCHLYKKKKTLQMTDAQWIE